jgi:hypothetical protein
MGGCWRWMSLKNSIHINVVYSESIPKRTYDLVDKITSTPLKRQRPSPSSTSRSKRGSRRAPAVESSMISSSPANGARSDEASSSYSTPQTVRRGKQPSPTSTKKKKRNSRKKTTSKKQSSSGAHDEEDKNDDDDGDEEEEEKEEDGEQEDASWKFSCLECAVSYTSLTSEDELPDCADWPQFQCSDCGVWSHSECCTTTQDKSQEQIEKYNFICDACYNAIPEQRHSLPSLHRR